jgi:hypothetical protein
MATRASVNGSRTCRSGSGTLASVSACVQNPGRLFLNTSIQSLKWGKPGLGADGDGADGESIDRLVEHSSAIVRTVCSTGRT